MSYNFFYRADDPDRFETAAAAYCAQRKIDVRYLSHFRDYQAAYSGTLIADRSFLVVFRGETVGIVYAPIEHRDDGPSLSIGGSYACAPVTDDEATEKVAYQQMDDIARESGATRIMLHACPSSHIWRSNRMRRYGYVDTSTLDVIMDLTQDENALWLSVRKSYRPMINKYTDRNGYRLTIIDAEHPNYELHEVYRHLHVKAAGRVTRDKETFDLQYRMLLDGNATLIVLENDQAVLGCAYFLHHGIGVDYFSMADDPELHSLRLPISHILVWAAARRFKGLGFRQLRLSPPAGFAEVGGFGDYADRKALAIAHFKHGMADDTVPYYRGIRYFSETAINGDVAAFRAAMLRQLKGVREGGNSTETANALTQN